MNLLPKFRMEIATWSLLPVLLATTPTASALAACPLQLLNSVPIQLANNQLTVQAVINGAPKIFQIDTAALANQLSDTAARAMRLGQTAYSGMGNVTGSAAALQNMLGAGTNLAPPMLEIYNAKGVMFKNIASVRDLTLGAMRIPSVDFVVTDLPPPGVDGILGMETFRRYDLDFNFPAYTLNSFSQDHCRGQVLYWRAPAMTALPFRSRDNRIMATVMLDGKELTAIIDTGSPISQIRLQDANRLFGLTRDSQGVSLSGDHNDNADLDRYVYEFKTLSFGSITLRNSRIMLTSAIPMRGADPTPHTGSRVASDSIVQPGMLIGMDLLTQLHLYIAFGERKLYVTQGPEMPPGSTGAQPTVPVTPFRP